MLWPANARHPAGLAQLSLYLAADMSARYVRECFDNWVRQLPPSDAALWRSAVVTVTQMSSALLHVLFYMPDSAHKELLEILHQMTGRSECAVEVSFDEGFRELAALTAMRDMLQKLQLAPKNLRLSTDSLGEVVTVALSSGKCKYPSAMYSCCHDLHGCDRRSSIGPATAMAVSKRLPDKVPMQCRLARQHLHPAN